MHKNERIFLKSCCGNIESKLRSSYAMYHMQHHLMQSPVTTLPNFAKCQRSTNIRCRSYNLTFHLYFACTVCIADSCLRILRKIWSNNSNAWRLQPTPSQMHQRVSTYFQAQLHQQSQIRSSWTTTASTKPDTCLPSHNCVNKHISLRYFDGINTYIILSPRLD